MLRLNQVLRSRHCYALWRLQGPNCTWFGAEVPCSLYSRLGIANGSITAVNMLCSTILAILGGQAMLFSSAGSMCGPCIFLLGQKT